MAGQRRSAGRDRPALHRAGFPTTEQCETYGHDLLTGAAVTEQEHRAIAPAGRAFLKGCAYTPAHEEPSADYPLLYTTGRTVYQFHTRTKTARSRSLHDAAPDAWVELNPADAEDHGISEGDVVRVESPRGAIEVKTRVGNVMQGAVFAPFHYGSWDLDGADPAQQSRLANELTMTVWDPVSKQPYFKTAACRVRKGQGRRRARTGADHRGLRPGPRTRPAHRGRRTDDEPSRRHAGIPERPGAGHFWPRADRDDCREVLMPHVATYVRLAHQGEQTLAKSFRTVGHGHANVPDVFHTCETLAKMSDAHEAKMAPIAQRYADKKVGEDVEEPERLHAAGLAEGRTGEIGLVRDLQDLYVLATLVQTTWTVLAQGAQGLRDRELLDVANSSNAETSRQLAWLNTRMKAAAPQALIVAP